MKKFSILACALSLAFTASAQKIKVRESNEKIGDGNHNSFVVTLYGVSPDDAEDSFRSFIDKFGGKRKHDFGGIFVDNAKINDISNNEIDIYGKAKGSKGDKEIEFAVAVDMGGVYLNSGDHKSESNKMESIVKEFAVKATKDAIERELKDANKVQSKLENDQKDLEKENKNLLDDIEKYKDKIKKAEDDIVTNKSNQEKKKGEIEAQKKVVGTVADKLKAVD
jgi:hypothetical protein